MKKAIFEEQTANALRKWQKAAKERRRLKKAGGEDIPSGISSVASTPSRGSSPLPLLHKYKFKTNNNTDLESSPQHNYHFETELSDVGDPPSLVSSDDQGIRRPMSPKTPNPNGKTRGDDFTFASP